MVIADTIINKVNLIDYIGRYTKLRKSNNQYRGLCPIHGGDNSGSLSTNGKVYHCFSCKSGGTVINFVADVEGISWGSALEKLADEFNIDIESNEEYVRQRDLVKENERIISLGQKHIEKVIDYFINERGLTEEIINEFELGYDNNFGIMIPIRDINGRAVAFARRMLQGKIKYINTKNNDLYDKSALLFNLDKAKKRINGKLLISEGYFDCIAAHQQGYASVAYCGSEMTREQITLLKSVLPNSSVEIILGADNDKAGKMAIPRMRTYFQQIIPNVSVRVHVFPDGCKDYNDVLKAGIDIGSLPTEHIDLYCLQQIMSQCASTEAEYGVVAEYIKSVTNPMIKADIASYLAKWWNKSIEDIKKWFGICEMGIDDIMKDFKSVEQAISEYADTMNIDGLTLGFPTIDTSIGSIRRSEVVVLGAYSSVGKTFLANEIALHNILRNEPRANVLYFSLEMSAGSLMERMVARVLGMSTDELTRQYYEGKIADKFHKVKDALSKHLQIVDRSYLSLEEIDKRIKYANANIFPTPVDIVIIDYLQYLKGTATYEELSATAKALKTIAKENNVIVLCLSQLNRQGSTWEVPDMKMLRGAGDIEASADYVVMAHRPSENPKLTLDERDNMKDHIVLSIAKARRGSKTKQVTLLFDTEATRIREKI